MNSDILKILILLIGMPIWLPFAKALWKELDRAMREDGGLFGATPSPRQREQILAELAKEEDPLVNEPLAHVIAREQGAGARPARQAPASPSSGRAAASSGRARAASAGPRGFRR